jgi:NADPH:quinone reductase-like Zn-dependent oxidoreductase
MPARALFHTAPRCVEIRDVPAPRPASGEVIVATLFSGISSGTERLVDRGEITADTARDDTIDALGGAFRYPFTYGYACVGETEDSGQPVFAFHPHQDAFAAQLADLIPVPSVDPAAATLFPQVKTALQVTLDAETGYRDLVIVLGAGVLGLLTALQACGRMLREHRGQTVLVVSHITPIKIMLCQALDVPLTALFRMYLGPACVNEVQWRGSDFAAVRSLNDTRHIA